MKVEQLREVTETHSNHESLDGGSWQSKIQMNLLDVKAELELFGGFYQQPVLPSYERFNSYNWNYMPGIHLISAVRLLVINVYLT